MIEVYNAAFGTNYPPDTAVEITKLDDVLYMERINDVSFILDNKFVVLLEQQATVNQNMALRMLLYVARLYEKLLDNENLYRRKQIQVFTPVFVVFYNGSEEQPECTVQRLSDAFKEAIKICQAKGVMQEYLKEKGSEVLNMLTGEWDWDVARKVWREESFEKGMEQGIEQNQRKVIRSLYAVMSPELIAETLQLSLDYVKEVLSQPKEAV